MAQNLVRNPGFESGLTPWVARGSESLATTTTMQSGAKGLWVTNRTVDWQGAEQSLLGRLRPGASYSCSAWVRAETTTSQPLRLTFEQRDGAGTRYFPVATTIVTNNTWTFLSGTFSLNVSGELTALKFYVEGPAAGVELRVDNVAVVPLSGQRLSAGQRTVRMGGISELQVNTDLPFGRVAATDYHLAGTENSLKFSETEPSSNTFSYGSADAVLDHASANGQVSRGHALIWHGDVPTWVSNNAGTWTPSQFQAIAYNHIDKVVAHYRDRLFCWDVVNEAFNDNGTMRSTVWYDAPGIGYAGQGTKYIEESFKRARAADADCELIYNDYDTETVNAKSDAVFVMAQDFKTRGVPLDGIGFQFHINGTPDLSSMRANFQRFSDLGLNLHITEMDVRVPVDANGVATASALAMQGDTYFFVVGTALAYDRTTVVQTWGFSDRYSWIPSYFTGYGAALPLDNNLNRKPAWWALHNVLANQAETLTVVAQSAGDTTTLTTSTAFSAGSAQVFQANAASDFITLAAVVPYTGEYNVRVGVRKNNASGVFQCAATSSPGGAFTNIGTVQDTYAAATSYTELDLGSYTFTSAGTNQFRFTVTGKNGSSSDHDLTLDYLRLTPTGADGNQSPSLTVLSDQVATTGATVGPVAFGVSDRETVESGLTITVSSSNTALIPTGNITITGGGPERLLVATPVANSTGSTTITVTVTDAAGASSSDSFNVNVGALILAPTINAGQTPNGTLGQVFSYAITAVNNPTSWALSSGSLPAGVTLNATTGVLTGTPSNSGSFTPSFTAANAGGTSSAQSVAILIGTSASMVSESFDYAAGVGALASKNGGSNWNSSWDTGTNDTQATGLTYSSGGSLTSTGGKAVTKDSVASFRTLSASAYPEGTYWVSFLAKSSTASSTWGGLSLFNGAAEMLFIGKRWGTSVWGLERAGGVNSSTSVTSTTLLVAKIVLQPGSDRVILFTNPSLAATPADNTGVLFDNILDFSFDRIRLMHGLGAAETMEFDEIRVGSSYAGVTPTLSAATGIVTFRSTYGLASGGSQDLLTPAGDGVQNLLKYAFNMLGSGSGQAAALATPNAAILTANGSAGLPLIGIESGAGKLQLTYIRRNAASFPGITYAVEFSDALAGWAVNASAVENVTSIDTTFERVTVTDSATSSKRFVRVRVTTP